MKKLLLFSMIAMIGITASAADQTKEQYLAKTKAAKEKAGKPYDEAATIRAFERLDLNKDGVLNDEDAKLKAKNAK